MKKLTMLLLCALATMLLISCGTTPADTQEGADTTSDAAKDTTENTDTSETNTAENDQPETANKVEGNGNHVVALLMGRERIPGISGQYGAWQKDGKDLAHTPDKVHENGLRDIASVYYPSIGLYDVTDPDYQEYMMQLCKMTYIDTLNYYISIASDVDEGNWWGDSFTKTTLPLLEKYGLYATARLERPGSTSAAKADINTVKTAFTKILQKLEDRVLTIDGKPVLSQFSVAGITPGLVEDWKEEYLAEYGVSPFFMLSTLENLSAQWMSTADGYYGWIELDGDDVKNLPLEYTANKGDYRRYATAEQAINNHGYHLSRIKNLISQGNITYYSDGLCPGFDDIAVWGWGSGPRKIERGETALYESKWQSAVENNFPMVNIPTWDDWGEGTTIEPSLQYGIDYLEITRKYAAEYKDIEANTASLELPGWIYKIRKTVTNKSILQKMTEASQLIADGKFEEAEAIVKPYVISLNIPATSKDFFNYPTTPTIPLGGETTSPFPTQGRNGEEIFFPTADTYIKLSTGKQTDAGTEALVKVKRADSSSLTRYGYFKFDTTNTQLTAVKKATLRLYCSFANTKETEIASRDINLYTAGTDWTEQSFSWATKPAVGEKLVDIESSTFKSKTWIEIDVTDYVNANLGKTIAFALLNEGKDTDNNHLEFNSREAAGQKPELVLE